MKQIHFTERELDVMAVLWSLDSATVAEVREQLDDELAYTTVLSILRILEDKGHVGHREEGKAYRYYAKVGREAAGKSALSRLRSKIFEGSAELLLTQMVSDRDLSREELKRLRALLDERLGKKGGER
jgi:predicted transcriptional regulator